jgi:hypothetical protein
MVRFDGVTRATGVVLLCEKGCDPLQINAIRVILKPFSSLPFVSTHHSMACLHLLSL